MHDYRYFASSTLGGEQRCKRMEVKLGMKAFHIAREDMVGTWVVVTDRNQNTLNRTYCTLRELLPLGLVRAGLCTVNAVLGGDSPCDPLVHQTLLQSVCQALVYQGVANEGPAFTQRGFQLKEENGCVNYTHYLLLQTQEIIQATRKHF